MIPDQYRISARFESLDAEARAAQGRLVAIAREVENECPAPHGSRWAMTSSGLRLADKGIGRGPSPSPMNFLRTWRAQGDDGADKHTGVSGFDEVVVGDWLHAEAMDDDAVWMRVGPLRFWIRKHGERVRIKIERESCERRYEVKIEGDLEQDQVCGDDLAHRALVAYEVARGWDRAVVPDAKRLTRAVRSLVGPMSQDRSRRDR